LWHVIENSKPDLPLFYSAFFTLLSKITYPIEISEFGRKEGRKEGMEVIKKTI
jgi:hypothetical protein